MLGVCSTPAGGIRNRPYRFKWKRAPTAERNRSALKFRNAFGASRAPLPSLFAHGDSPPASRPPCAPAASVILGRARHRRVEGRGSSAGLVEDAVEPSALLTLDPRTVLLFVCARRLRYAEPAAGRGAPRALRHITFA